MTMPLFIINKRYPTKNFWELKMNIYRLSSSEKAEKIIGLFTKVNETKFLV